MGVTGLALAFSLSSILNFLLLFFWIYLETEAVKIKEIIVSIIKFSIAAIGAGLAAQITKSLVWPYIDMTRFSGVFIQLITASLAALIFYILIGYFLKSPELLDFLRSLKRRWPFKKVKLDDQGEARGL